MASERAKKRAQEIYERLEQEHELHDPTGRWDEIVAVELDRFAAEERVWQDAEFSIRASMEKWSNADASPEMVEALRTFRCKAHPDATPDVVLEPDSFKLVCPDCCGELLFSKLLGKMTIDRDPKP